MKRHKESSSEFVCLVKNQILIGFIKNKGFIDTTLDDPTVFMELICFLMCKKRINRGSYSWVLSQEEAKYYFVVTCLNQSKIFSKTCPYLTGAPC